MLHFLRVLIYLIYLPLCAHHRGLCRGFTCRHLFVIWCQRGGNKQHGKPFSIIQTGTSGLSMERVFIPASGIEVTPAYLEKRRKSEAVSEKTEEEEGRSTIACMGTRLQHKRLSSNSISPHKEGPAIIVHEQTDELSGVVHFSRKSPSHYWHCQVRNTKNSC